jgi:translocation and assembly module TamB
LLHRGEADLRPGFKLKKSGLLHLGLIGGLLLVTLGLLLVINYMLDQRMAQLKINLLSMFHDVTGRDLSYGSISPSILQYFEIRDLAIHDPEADSGVLLRVKTLKIHYNLFRLLTAPDPLSSISEINIEHSEFNLDLEKERELADALVEFIKDRLSKKIDVEFSLTGSNLRFNISDNNYNLLLSKLFLTLNNERDAYGYKVRGDVHFITREQGAAGFRLDTEMDFGGKVSKQFTWFDMLANIYSTDSDDFSLAAQKFQVSLKDNLLTLNKIQDRTPLDLTGRYDGQSQTLRVNVVTENWLPAHLLRFKSRLAEYNPWLAASVSASGDLEYRLPEKGMSYSLDLHAALPRGARTPGLRLATKVRGNEDLVSVRPFLVTGDPGRIEFNGTILTRNLYPEGTLSLKDVTTGISGTVNADFTITRSYRGFSLAAGNTIIGKTDLKKFDLSLEPRKGELAFELKTVLGHAAPGGMVSASGNINYGRGYALHSEWTFTNLPLSELYSVGTPDRRRSDSLYEGLKNYDINSHLRFDADQNNFSLSSADAVVSDHNNPDNTMSLDISADARHIVCREYKGEWFGLPLHGDLEVALPSAKNTQFETLLHINEVPYAFSGLVVPGQGVVISGTYDLSASVLVSETQDLRFWVKSVRLPLPIHDHMYFATLNCMGYVKADGEWQVSSVNSRLYNLPVHTDTEVENYLDASFTLSPHEFNLSRLRYVDTISEVRGSGKFDISSLSPLSGSGWLYLEDKDTDESYTAELELLPGSLNLDFTFHNSPLSRLGELALKGNLSGRIRAEGPYEQPFINAELVLEHGSLNTAPFSMDVNISLTADTIVLNSLECTYNNNLTITGAAGQADRDNGDFQFGGHLAGYFLGEYINTDTLLAGNLPHGDYNSLFTSFWDNSFTGRLQFFNISAQRENRSAKSYESWELLFSKDANELVFNGGPQHAVRGRFAKNGAFDIDLAEPLPLRSHIEGMIKNNHLEAKAQNLFLNLQLLNPLIASKYFVFKGGTAQGELTLTGDIADPQYYGLIEVKNASIATDVSPDIIAPVNTAISFQNNEMRLTNTKTYFGDAPVNVFAVLTIRNWVPTQYALDVKTLDTIGIHLAFPADVVNIDGFFLTPNFKLVGDSKSLRAEGDLVLPRCNITLGNTGGEAGAADNYMYLVNLNIKTGKAVAFTWPSRDFPIIQAVSKPGALLAVRYNGSSGKYTFTGDVDLQSGEVYYFDRDFFIRSGLISFRENEKRFDPIISLEAEKREQFDGKDLKIFLTLKNQYLSEFEPHFRSEPPLASEYDILTAMGGAFPNQENQTNENALDLAVNLGSDILTQVWVLRPFERVVKEILHLDVFSIRTQIVKNILTDKVFTGNNPEDQTTALEGKSYLENTSINLGQYIGEKNDLYFEMVLRFQSMDAQAPEYESLIPDKKLNVESEFSLELTTPFFLTIKWTVTPQHWESFFLPDNKITLKWGFSF